MSVAAGTLCSEALAPVVALDQLVPGRGVAALLPDGSQVALFLLSDGSIHAVDNHDPSSGANVISRGLTGWIDGDAVVASPITKARFSLTHGTAIGTGAIAAALTVHRVEVIDGIVTICTEPASGPEPTPRPEPTARP